MWGIASVDVSELLARIRQRGYCILDEVIPVAEVDLICREVIAAQQAHHTASEVELAKTRARGHRIGVPGVGLLKQVINVTQCFARYLANWGIVLTCESV